MVQRVKRAASLLFGPRVQNASGFLEAGLEVFLRLFQFRTALGSREVNSQLPATQNHPIDLSRG